MLASGLISNVGIANQLSVYLKAATTRGGRRAARATDDSPCVVTPILGDARQHIRADFLEVDLGRLVLLVRRRPVQHLFDRLRRVQNVAAINVKLVLVLRDEANVRRVWAVDRELFCQLQAVAASVVTLVDGARLTGSYIGGSFACKSAAAAAAAAGCMMMSGRRWREEKTSADDSNDELSPERRSFRTPRVRRAARQAFLVVACCGYARMRARARANSDDKGGGDGDGDGSSNRHMRAHMAREAPLATTSAIGVRRRFLAHAMRALCRRYAAATISARALKSGARERHINADR